MMFGAILVVVALLSAALNPAFNAVMNATAAQASTAEAQAGMGYIQAFWDFKTWIALLLGVVMLIAGALAESRRAV
jgi:hypothetical protein